MGMGEEVYHQQSLQQRLCHLVQVPNGIIFQTLNEGSLTKAKILIEVVFSIKHDAISVTIHYISSFNIRSLTRYINEPLLQKTTLSSAFCKMVLTHMILYVRGHSFWSKTTWI